jgi:DNA topoisomerase-1
MEQFHHNGVLVPPAYTGQGLSVIVRGEAVLLNDGQEELAMAWAKKIGTPYVEDLVFAENFHADFSELLGVKVLPGDVDYTDIHRLVLKEREWRANLSREERKALAAGRKAVREANKERYGYAVIDGERCEVGNYTAEPSSIFMGRGEHPWRGKWKEGPRHEDIELNLSPDAPKLEGDWKEIHWDSESIWIARWRDKLSGKMKYVWPSDNSPIKQKKEIAKFDKAIELRKNLRKVQRYIHENLTSDDVRRQKTATVCYLIDELKFRIGDEKDDDDEADTVGASSLRPEHLCFNEDGSVTFDFLGKDSVRHILKADLDERVVNNLKKWAENTDSTLFDEVNSSRVSEFLDEVITGLSAKVFRTCHATETVEGKLRKTTLGADEPEFKKKHVATMANLEAAIICNHKRTIPKTWEQSLQRKKDRLVARRKRAREGERKAQRTIIEQEAKYQERLSRYEVKLEETRSQLASIEAQLKERITQGKSTAALEKRVASKRRSIKTQRDRIKKLKQSHRERQDKRRASLEARKERNKLGIEKAKLQIEAYEMTRDYNLGTSLKSYIDPRIYYDWSRKVGYDWKKYYSKTLQKKFSWVEPDQESVVEAVQ